ncbi:GFA family protein [Allosphingosinicella deserti]|uniref:Aldehyde-activating protein n=1 Tax=Allosphingosinicella deserti TaxID=2116704 RepID=A0A2P7QZM4_9SPHN|nr:GFA family protein [Sphingomonas deserti]PSJ43411.1 aldehyde-activating protein [Sphingomonas deserti]
MANKHMGRCSCGAVTFEFSSDPTFVADCYCIDCQKSSGGVMSTYLSVPEEDFVLLSGEPKGFQYTADSGNTLVRNFCPTCGARVFTNQLQGFPGTVFVMMGALDHPEAIIPPIMEIFTKRRIAWTRALDVPQYPARPDAG